jgi:hypothetical protein
MVIENAGMHALIFETDNGVVTRYRVGTLEAVQYIEGCS